MTYTKYEVLRDPISGERLTEHFSVRGKTVTFGPTGVLKGSSRDYPVLGGVVLMREDLATEKVTGYAREGQLFKALFEALKIEKRSTYDTLDLLLRLRYPTLLQCGGSPYAGIKGAYGTYFRYRYSIANAPSTIGLLSCLKRTAPKDGYFLDVGSGLGHFYRYYLHSFPAEKIVLADYGLDLLITASRFVDPHTLLVCFDANKTVPFQKKLFTDITILNAFQCFDNKERFVHSAIEVLDPDVGTMWITNNWNPKLTDQFTLPARTPTEWRAFCNSEKWHLFPERHFAGPVLRGGLVNLGVQYVPHDDDPAWRSVTLAYSNVPWESHNKCVPLNRAPNWQNLATNSVYYRNPFRNRLLKRKVSIKYWDSHKEYYGFDLPKEVILPGKVDRQTGRGLQSLAESLVMVESLCPATQSPVLDFLWSVCAWLKGRSKDLTSGYRAASFVKSFIPRSIKISIRRLLASARMQLVL